MNLSKRFQFLFLSLFILSFFIFLTINDSFATSATNTSITSPITIDFRTISNTGTADDVQNSTVSFNKVTYFPGDTGAIITVNDANANVTSSAVDFITATVDGSSLTLTESAVNSGIFSSTFTVGDTDPTASYTPDPKNAIRAQIVLPSGFTGDLTFSDSIVSDSVAKATGFFPVTTALKITGTLNVQPEIFISYANSNFTGSGGTFLDLGMWYREPGEQFVRITLPFTGGDNNFIDTGAKTIKSKNSDDTGSLTGGPGILTGPAPDGGWVGVTDYQGEYVLGVYTGSPGGGGGGLVSPGLVVNALAGIGAIGGGGGSGGSAPLTSLNQLISSTTVDLPEEVKQMIENHDSSIPILPMDPDSFEDFDFPLVINDQGFVLGGFTSTLQTQTIPTNTPVTMEFVIYEAETIQHFSIYMNLRGVNDSIADSDTQILYNDGKELQIIDKKRIII